MTIGEARTAYYAQYKKFSEAAYETAQQKKAAEEKMKTMLDYFRIEYDRRRKHPTGRVGGIGG